MTKNGNGKHDINEAPHELMKYATTTEWMPDRDGDGVVDPWDCVPWDPDKQGILGDAWAYATRVVSSRAAIARRAYSGARSRASGVASRVAGARRAYSSARSRATGAARRVYSATRSAGMRRVRPSIVRSVKHVPTTSIGGIVRTAKYVTGIGATRKPAAEGTGFRSEVAMRDPTLIGDIRRAVSPVSEYFGKTTSDRASDRAAGEQAFVERGTSAVAPMSELSRGIHETTQRIGRTARGFETPVDKRVRDAERALGMHSDVIPSQTRWLGAQLKGLGYGIAFAGPAAIVEMAGMIPGGVETIRRQPSILPAAATYGVYSMGKGMFEGFTQRPGKTLGEFISMGAVTKGAKVPQSVKQHVKVPQSIKQHVKVPQSVKQFADAKLPQVLTKKGVKPEGFGELSAAKQLKYEAGVKVLKALYETRGTQMEPLDFTTVKALPGKSGLMVEKWIKAHPEQSPVMSGSAVPRTQIKGTRVPGDVDIHVIDRGLAAKQLYAELKPVLGDKVRIDKGGTGIETRTADGKWTHAVDLQPAFPPRELIISELPWSLRPDPITIGGIKYATIGEQLMRKASQTLQIRTPKTKKSEKPSWEMVGGKRVHRKDIELGPGMEEHVVKPGDPTLGPFSHRAHKDVYDFMDIADQVIAGRIATAESARFFKGYRTGMEAKTLGALETYKMHGSLYPDPYPAYRAYKSLPSYTKTPAYTIAASTVGSRYPQIPKYPTPKYPPPKTPKYPTPKTPKYPTPKTPKYPTPVTPKYPTPVTPKYPTPVTPKYPTPVTPKYPTPKTPKYPTPKTPKTSKHPTPKTLKTPTRQTYPTMVDRHTYPLQPKQPKQKTRKSDTGKKKIRTEAEEARGLVGSPVTHDLVTLKSFAGSTQRKRIDPMNIV